MGWGQNHPRPRAPFDQTDHARPPSGLGGGWDELVIGQGAGTSLDSLVAPTPFRLMSGAMGNRRGFVILGSCDQFCAGNNSAAFRNLTAWASISVERCASSECHPDLSCP